MKLAIAAMLAAAVPGVAQAQAYRCAVPATIVSPHADLPSASQPKRLMPIGSHTLAITWAPQYCRDHAGDTASRFQCGAGNRFGFTLHGLWPDGVGAEWPQYCARTAIVPRKVIRETICATPSPQLIQHEWAKHGTCMKTTPAAYFRSSTGLFGTLRYPDMDALSRAPLTAGAFARAVAKANRGLPAGAIRVTGRQGWLDEVWLCLDQAYRYTRCRPDSGGLPANAALQIWRGGR